MNAKEKKRNLDPFAGYESRVFRSESNMYYERAIVLSLANVGLKSKQLYRLFPITAEALARSISRKGEKERVKITFN